MNIDTINKIIEKSKTKRMQGNSGKCIWVVMASHPLYSITWTWAIYWTQPNCFKSIRWFKNFGFRLSTQDVMLKDWAKG